MADAKAKHEPIYRHKLSKTLMSADGDELTELEFRQPTAGDLVRCGQPVKFKPWAPDDISFDATAMTDMMSALSAEPPYVLKQMDPRDWSMIAWNLASFFVPIIPESS
jgi:hypothetical protein